MPDGTSFGAAADDYEAGRPEYPADAVAWMVPDAARRVADVGAGTGKLTRALVAPGREVVAVDPDPAMLTTLEAVLPGVTTLVGRAEALPVPDGSFDAVVFGQAWHWVDVSIAVPEVARVLAPGGTLGLVWNIRDEREPWVAEMTAIIGSSPAEGLLAGDGPHVGPPFGPLKRLAVPWSRTTTVDEVLAMARSRSPVIALGEEALPLLARLERLLLGVADGDTLHLPYVTQAFRAMVV